MSEQIVCHSEELIEGGAGRRFSIRRSRTQTLPAFVVRFKGAVHAYINQCAHQPLELDWQPGIFFDRSQQYLICANHGALYAPDSGACISGHCGGRGLQTLKVEERGGHVYLVETSNGIHLVDNGPAAAGHDHDR